jgi:hypothetical protein
MLPINNSCFVNCRLKQQSIGGRLIGRQRGMQKVGGSVKHWIIDKQHAPEALNWIIDKNERTKLVGRLSTCIHFFRLLSSVSLGRRQAVPHLTSKMMLLFGCLRHA